MVPMAIVGARSAMRKGSFIISPVTIRVRVGPPVPTAGTTLDQRDEVTQRLRERILGLLQESTAPRP
jgi:1-acyl-sn-glycerol-3-phosphate acyltransferase